MGLRQRCPLSSVHNSHVTHTVDVTSNGCRKRDEKESDGVRIGEEKLWSSAHADNLVIMAKNEEGMKEMIKKMEKYLKEKS